MMGVNTHFISTRPYSDVAGNSNCKDVIKIQEFEMILPVKTLYAFGKGRLLLP